MTETPAALRTMISPGRYVQGRGALQSLGANVAKLGKRPVVLADDIVRELTETTITKSFGDAGLPVVFEHFNGVPTAAESRRMAGVLREQGADAIIGVGGGAPIDTAKAAGDDTGLPTVSVPTVASTDAPCSALSVVYTAEGAFEAYRFYDRNPALVLVDTQLAANAPARFLVAGIGDALATWIEARAVEQSNAATMAGGQATGAGRALAKLSWDILWESALPAVHAVQSNLVTPAVEVFFFSRVS